MRRKQHADWEDGGLFAHFGNPAIADASNHEVLLIAWLQRRSLTILAARLLFKSIKIMQSINENDFARIDLNLLPECRARTNQHAGL